MKFIHIADVHWGMNPDSDRPWSRERAQAIRDSFAEVIRQARLRVFNRVKGDTAKGTDPYHCGKP